MTQMPGLNEFGKVVGLAMLVWFGGILVHIVLPGAWGAAAGEFANTVAWGILVVGLMPFVRVPPLSPHLKALMQRLYVAMAVVFAIIEFMDYDGMTTVEVVFVVALMALLVAGIVYVGRLAHREFKAQQA